MLSDQVLGCSLKPKRPFFQNEAQRWGPVLVADVPKTGSGGGERYGLSTVAPHARGTMLSLFHWGFEGFFKMATP